MFSSHKQSRCIPSLFLLSHIACVSIMCKLLNQNTGLSLRSFISLYLGLEVISVIWTLLLCLWLQYLIVNAALYPTYFTKDTFCCFATSQV